MNFLVIGFALFLLSAGQHAEAFRNSRIHPLKHQKHHPRRVLGSSGGLRVSPRDTATPGKSWLPVTIIGVGASERGSRSISNEDFQGVLDTSDAWIQKRTGIRSRRVLVPNEPAGLRSMAVDAAEKALLQAGMKDGKDIQLVIVASSSPDDLFGDAPSVAAAVGASTAVAFDVTAACSGFVFAVITASQFIQSGSFKNALVIGADALSRHVDWADRGSCILFGDGAGAAVLTHTPGESGILGFAMHSDGRGYHHLTLPFVPREATLQQAVDERKATSSSEANVSHAADAAPSSPTVDVGSYGRLAMNGAEVFRFAVSTVPEVIREALANAGLGVDDVDHFVLHQANFRIIEHVAKELGVDLSRFVVTLEDSGNTSAASIPLALAAAVSGNDEDPGRRTIRKGDVVVICGFGAGLSWGSAVLRWGGPL